MLEGIGSVASFITYSAFFDTEDRVTITYLTFTYVFGFATHHKNHCVAIVKWSLQNYKYVHVNSHKTSKYYSLCKTNFP